MMTEDFDWVPEQVARAGGVDVLGTAGAPSVRTTWDALRAADPDVIVMACCGFDQKANEEQLSRIPKDLRAVSVGRVAAVDANSYYSRPAPRLVDGAEQLAVLLRKWALLR